MLKKFLRLPGNVEWRTIVLAFILGFSSQAMAQEEEILIQQDEEASYYEHRVNGIVTEIKVVPKVGPAYFLVPADGGGWIKAEESQVLVPKWKIFEW